MPEPIETLECAIDALHYHCNPMRHEQIIRLLQEFARQVRRQALVDAANEMCGLCCSEPIEPANIESNWWHGEELEELCDAAPIWTLIAKLDAEAKT
jgi:hypothetical protein